MDIERAVDRLGRGRISLEPMTPPPSGLRPESAAQAYALQHRLHRRYREAGLGPIAGYKIGCTTAVMQAYLGIDHPCAGGVLASTVHHGSASVEGPARFLDSDLRLEA